jgi:hypothetical protein
VPRRIYEHFSTFGMALIVLITVIAFSNDIGPKPH